MTRTPEPTPTVRITTCLLLSALATSLVIPPGAANHDGDPFSDSAEALVCGFPDAAGVLNGLPGVAGRCTTNSNYLSPLVQTTGCVECSGAVAYSRLDEPLTSAQDVSSMPLPAESVPAVGPYNTPPVEQPVGTIQGYRSTTDPDSYCVVATPAEGSPEFACVDVGNDLAPLLPPIPPTALIDVDGQTAGPTQSVPAGSLGSTPPQHVPAFSFDLLVGYQWVENRLNRRVDTSQLDVWEPVDLDLESERRWWVDNGHKTTLDVILNVKSDGQTQQSIRVHVPFAGQAIAAALKSGP